MNHRRVLAEDVWAETLDVSTIVAGASAVASTALGSELGLDIGVWEITPGVVLDTEADEVFIALAGRATVTFADGDVVSVEPGSIVRLRAGEQTVWEITETLRKVYFLLRESSSKQQTP